MSRLVTDVSSDLRYYLRYYTQYYSGDLDFCQYVLDSLYQDYLVDCKGYNLSLYDIQASLKLITAVLLLDMKLRKELENGKKEHLCSL